MGASPSKNLQKGTDSHRLAFKEFGSSSQVDDDPSSASNSDCLVDVSLPHELITEILVRLPVKSLLRFKCVSKSWLSLISDPQFIRSNFSKSICMEANSLNLHVLFATKTSLKKCPLYSVLHEADPCRHLSAFVYSPQNDRPIVGIINGLVCLNLKGNDLCVWNPALNKIQHLKAPSGPRRLVSYLYSFGYDESNDDYKVVCFQSLQGNDCEVRIYSLKADSWRRIYKFKGYYLHFPGVFANGKIYWCTHLFATPKGNFLSLDMSSEKFVELQPPQYENDGDNCVTRMGESGGRPLMLCNYYIEKKVVLWLLHKQGVEECWRKFVSIPYTEFVNPSISMFNSQVLCIFTNGDIVFGDANELQVYNYKKKESRSIEMAVGITTTWIVAAYVESLVWPDFHVSNKAVGVNWFPILILYSVIMCFATIIGFFAFQATVKLFWETGLV